MSTARRFMAFLTTVVLLLQSLQGSGLLCMAHPSGRSTLSRVSLAGDDVQSGSSRMDGGSHDAAMAMSHGDAVPTARSARAIDADPQSLSQDTPSNMPSHRGDCPDRESPRACVTMTTCATAAAVPTFTVVAMSPRLHADVVAARLTQPPLVTRAPELPPPRA